VHTKGDRPAGRFSLEEVTLSGCESGQPGCFGALGISRHFTERVS
jgi:hypothetical protein